MTGEQADVYHIKGIADEEHRHADYAERLLRLEVLQAELRAEWDEFIAANAEQKDAE